MTVPTRTPEMTHVLPFLSPVRPPAWLRRRVVWLGGVLAVLLVAVGALIVTSGVRSTPSAAPALPAPAAAVPITARGLVQPVRSARVGTLNGGVVRQLNVSLDNEVTEQSIVAWVAGPSGTEVVTAPFAGSVTNVLVHEGDTVLPGTVIAIVADTRSLQVETVDVDEYVISQVHVGQPVQVTVDALGNSTLAGNVSGVSLLPQAAASGEQTYPVIISVSAMPPDVRAGMSVRVVLRD
jgi:multidrug efflux pump subunit AcrA (membrane-fusion protein)